jgi:hypothetical protein
MEAAYTDGAGRTNTNGINLLGGLIGGSTLMHGVYTFTTDVNIALTSTSKAQAHQVQTKGKPMSSSFR